MMDQVKTQGIVALIYTALLFLGSLVIHQGSSYLGMQANGLAAAIASFYPMALVSEALKLFALSFVLILAGVSGLALVRPRRLQAESLPAALAAGLGLLLPYLLLLGASQLQYPALYEAYLPASYKQMLYQGSFHWNPLVLRQLAWVAFAGFALIGCRKQPLYVGGVLLASLAGVAVLSFAARTSPSPLPMAKPLTADAPPDIVIIAVDSLRFDRSEDPSRTPNLARLKADAASVTFTDHQVGIPRTFPSWIEMLRGSYAARTGIRHMFPSLPARRHHQESFVSLLREQGYRTGVFSDFAGDIFPRFEGGFDEVAAPKLDLGTLIRMGVVQGLPLLLPFALSPAGEGLFNSLLENPAFGDPQRLITRAQQWMAASTSPRPTLTTIFFSTAHFPYAAPWPWYKHFAAPQYDGPFYFQKNPLLNEQGASLRPVDKAHIRALYDGGVAAVDAAIGALMQWLQASGRWRNTLLVVTADHGEDLFEDGFLQGHGEHLRGDHVLHVPLILKLPGGATPPQPRLDMTSRSIDLAPTILGVTGYQGAGALAHMDGRDLSPWLRTAPGAPPKPELAAYSETGIWFARYGEGFYQGERLDYPGINELLSFNPGGTGEVVLNPRFEATIVGAKHRSLIRGDYKLIYQPTSQGPLYHLYQRRRDPYNTYDLKEVEPARFASLKAELLQLIGQLEGEANIYDDLVVPH